jgi:putative endonuclease
MKSWHLYIVRCKDGSLYTGITIDIEKRVKEHQNQGKRCARYLRGKAPITLEFSQCIGTKSDAFRVEKMIKKCTKHKKEKLLSGKLLLSSLID